MSDDFNSITLSSSPTSNSSSSFIQITSTDVPLSLTPTQLRALYTRYPSTPERNAYISLHKHMIRLCCSPKPLDQWVFHAVETVLGCLDKRTEEVRRLTGDVGDMDELVKGLWGEMGDLLGVLGGLQQRLNEKDEEVEVLGLKVGEGEMRVTEGEAELRNTQEELRKRNREVEILRERLRERNREIEEGKAELERKREEVRMLAEMQEKNSEEENSEEKNSEEGLEKKGGSEGS